MRVRLSIERRKRADKHKYLVDSTLGRPEDYFIKPGYCHRTQVSYCRRRPGSVNKQAEVYAAAALLVERTGARGVVDLGCGDGEKTVSFFEGLDVVGVDFGPNIADCRERYPDQTWLEVDLGRPHRLPIPDLAGRVVVCADVLEHLLTPDPLLATLRELATSAAAIVISTPERDLERGCAHMGPPPNKKHAREWNLVELQRLLHHWEIPATLCLARNSATAQHPRTILATTAPLYAPSTAGPVAPLGHAA